MGTYSSSSQEKCIPYAFLLFSFIVNLLEFGPYLITPWHTTIFSSNFISVPNSWNFISTSPLKLLLMILQPACVLPVIFYILKTQDFSGFLCSTLFLLTFFLFLLFLKTFQLTCPISIDICRASSLVLYLSHFKTFTILISLKMCLCIFYVAQISNCHWILIPRCLKYMPSK